MSYKRNSKLNLPILISIILHAVLIFILGYRALHDSEASYGDVNGQSIDAIMVDPSVMTEQYQRQLQNQMSQKKAEQQRQQQLDNQAKELQEKQLEEQQRLKEIEKERLKAVAEQQKQEKAAAEKAAAEKAAAEKAAAEKAAAEKAAAEKAAAEKAAAEKAAAEKAAAEKAAAEKAAADKAAKQKAAAAAAAKNDKALNDILGGLTSSGAPTQGTTASRKGVSNGELDKYKSLVQNAISNKFINPNKMYSGRNCVLRIQIAPDGLLLNVAAEGGDEALCREALAATKLAVIPKPSSTLYNDVKTMIIDFQPK